MKETVYIVGEKDSLFETMTELKEAFEEEILHCQETVFEVQVWEAKPHPLHYPASLVAEILIEEPYPYLTYNLIDSIKDALYFDFDDEYIDNLDIDKGLEKLSRTLRLFTATNRFFYGIFGRFFYEYYNPCRDVLFLGRMQAAIDAMVAENNLYFYRASGDPMTVDLLKIQEE